MNAARCIGGQRQKEELTTNINWDINKKIVP
jgi:hypothetical protein